MAKKRSLADADAEIAALRATLAATGTAGAEPVEVVRFPCVMYKKHRVDEKHPNGYEARRVKVVDDKDVLDVEKCEAEVTRLEQAGWVHSPAEFAA